MDVFFPKEGEERWKMGWLYITLALSFVVFVFLRGGFFVWLFLFFLDYCCENSSVFLQPV